MHTARRNNVASSRFDAFNMDKFEQFEDMTTKESGEDGYSTDSEDDAMPNSADVSTSSSSSSCVLSQEPMKVDSMAHVRISTDSGMSILDDDEIEMVKQQQPQHDELHKLNSRWRMSYRNQDTKLKLQSEASYLEANNSFSDCLEEVSTCESIEEFWQMLNRIYIPTQLKYRSSPNYFFFRDGIKPEWEDATNMDGGMWRIVLKGRERSEHLDMFWFELLMALVGEQFHFSQYITGCVLQRRQKEDRIQLWTRCVRGADAEADRQVQRQIGRELKRILNLAGECELAYTLHNDLKRLELARRDSRQITDRSLSSGRRSNSRGGGKAGSIDRATDAPVVYKNHSFNMRMEQASKKVDGYRV